MAPREMWVRQNCHQPSAQLVENSTSRACVKRIMAINIYLVLIVSPHNTPCSFKQHVRVKQLHLFLVLLSIHEQKEIRYILIRHLFFFLCGQAHFQVPTETCCFLDYNMGFLVSSTDFCTSSPSSPRCWDVIMVR